MTKVSKPGTEKAAHSPDRAENPAEYTTCNTCGHRRKLPDRCKCKGRAE